MSAKDTYVFLGPTLSIDTANTILPARYLPPIKCGDILRLMRLRPKIIIIIDGAFEQTASVWHKEILYALQQDIRVIGASSMGALRAAELSDFGMIGIGKIFQEYQSGCRTDDADVAVMMSPMPPYAAINDPLVNIEASLQQGSLSRDKYSTLLKQAETKFYPARQLHELDQNIDLIDQKAIDAIQALEYVAQNEITPPDINFTFPQTIYFRTLFTRMQCCPFIRDYEWLPNNERNLLNARILGSTYCDLKTATLLYAITDLTVTDMNKALKKLFTAIKLDSLNIKSNLPRFRNITNTLLKEREIKHALSFLLRLKKCYIQGFCQMDLKEILNQTTHNDTESLCLLLSALCWGILHQKIANLSLTVSDQTIQIYAQRLANALDIRTPEALDKWRTKNELCKKQYFELIIQFFYFDYFVLSGNNDLLHTAKMTKNYDYLHEVMTLCDAFALTNTYLNDREHIYQFEEIVTTKPEMIKKLDFSSNIELVEWLKSKKH